jgi:hypothetical protein
MSGAADRRGGPGGTGMALRLVGVSVAVMGWVIGTLAAWTQSPLYKYCQIAFAE